MTLTQRSMALTGRLPLLANLILIIVLAWIISGWFSSGEAKIAQAEHAEELPAQTLPAFSEIQGSLFGSVTARSVETKPVIRQVVKSPLNIRLLGTVVAGDNSAAVVATAGKQQQVLFIGNELQPGVTLHEVLADAIVLDRHGNLEKVVMQKPDGIRSSSVRQSLKPDAPLRPAASSSAGKAKMPDVASAEFMALLSQARVMPHFVNGKAEGFVVSNIVPGSIYAQAGVENGDVVRKVNGQVISSAQQAMGIYQSLQKGGAIDVELLRAGQLQQVHYDFTR